MATELCDAGQLWGNRMTQSNDLTQQRHWEKMADESIDKFSTSLWRCFCDQLYLRFLNEWTGDRRFRAALKTDLFDEVVGDGLAEWLLSASDRVEGIDLVSTIAQQAARRHPGLVARQADVRCLDAYPVDHFDLVVSNSTLDHFADASDLAVAIAELSRVLMPNGLLFIALDNPQNPIVNVRNRCSSSSEGNSQLIPYFMGHTVSQAELCRMVETTGLIVERSDHLMHVPRVLFLHASKIFSPELRSGQALLGLMHAFEVLNYLPTRFLTGHYSAVLARKPN